MDSQLHAEPWREVLAAMVEEQDAVLVFDEHGPGRPAAGLPSTVRLVVLQEGTWSVVPASDGTARPRDPRERGRGDPTLLAAALRNAGVKRLLLAGRGTLEPMAHADLDRAGIATVPVPDASAPGADDYMDDEDSEAVAERLRQLGYL